ncbi:hypothetical protein R1sor_001508 [Riccia sorocarpa]|uniref:SWIM-type domain-containing protein n=1 Tax=Riccia sorocarpa TaxID=122646 RepID=A0ABD3H0A7_9MARC
METEGTVVCRILDQWVPKLVEWVLAYRNHKGSNQNTTGAVERWHSTVKAHIRSSRMSKVMRKLSWLVVLLTSTIELYFWCTAELKYQGRIRNKVVEDQIVTVCVKAKTIPDSMVMTELDGSKVRVFQSSSKPDTCYTVMDWTTKDSRCTCSMSAAGNVCKHEVKAMFMDGITETEIVKTLGRKAGSSSGGVENLSVNQELPLDLNADPADLFVPDEPEFHFPFDMNNDSLNGAPTTTDDQRPTTLEDIIGEVTKFADKMEGDAFYLSHFAILCRGAMEEVQNMKARWECNTTTVDSPALSVPNPLEAGRTTATELTRAKGWHEKMMDAYSRRKRRQALPEPDENSAIPLERVMKQKWPSLNETLDGEAIASLLGQNKENVAPPET